MTVTMTELASGDQFEAEEHEVAQLRAQGCKPTSELSTPPPKPPTEDPDTAGNGSSPGAETAST